MAKYKKYNFEDPAIDYDEVLATAFEMRSDLVAQEGCCGSSIVKKAMTEADTYLYISSYDKINNTERFKEDAKSAYLILYNVA